MNIHKNVRLTPRGRERLVLQVASGQTPLAAARDAGRLPADRPQMVGSPQSRRARRLSGPLAATPPPGVT
jgi:hypothetical protein